MSASPNGTPITQLITKGFESIGYQITLDLKTAVVNAADFGVPQNRNRIIIVGLNKQIYKEPQKLLDKFYGEILPKYRSSRIYTVREAIGDLPKLIPLFDEENHKKRRSHITPECSISWHVPRYSNLRDMDTFRILEEDIESGRREYDSKKLVSYMNKSRFKISNS
ncbi:DNA-cytosine methyltransferase [Lachnospiraceae bacterium TWA4]|nr:DNA-cytosine methyltransferase [Lachnospiraceae bacterium TWA4]